MSDVSPLLDGVVERPAAEVERWQALGYWTGELLDDVVERQAAERPDAVAIIDGEHAVTYAQLTARVAHAAGALAGLGIGRGDRVVVALPNTLAFFDVVFALFRLGALPVFALPAHRRVELAHFCTHTDAVALVTTGRDGRTDLRPLAAELLSTLPSLRHVVLAGDRATADAAGQPDGVVDLPTLVTTATPAPADAQRTATDVAFLQLSGGSTGVPKLIPRTHAEYAYSVRESAAICGLSPATVFLAAIPVAHNFTLSSPGTLGVFHAGGRVVLAADPSPDGAFALIERHRVTIASLVPPLALLWIDAAPRAAQDLSSLAVVQVGGANFDPAAAAQLEPALGCRLQQVFGMAEGLVNYTRLDDPDELVVGTQGRPISPHDELLVVDDDDVPVPAGVVGHLLTRGPYTIRGYYRAAEHNARAFTADGYYRTGDLVRVRPDGYVVVEGRHKDVVNRGGEKIAAAEVEEHLRAHPNVHDVALVGVPDRLLGERSCAIVVPVGEPPSRVALRRFLVDRGLAAYKLPDHLEIVDELPKTGVGKVAKNVLRERFGRPSPTEQVEEP